VVRVGFNQAGMSKCMVRFCDVLGSKIFGSRALEEFDGQILESKLMANSFELTFFLLIHSYWQRTHMQHIHLKID
jgi:hypothetical protein